MDIALARPPLNPTLAQALVWAGQQLADKDDAEARTNAEFLMMHLLQCSRSRLIIHAESTLSAENWQDFQALIQRRCAGEPVAYITGTRGFWTLDLQVTPDVLIPRPDTETLVESVLALADKQTSRIVIDLGTGSGAIALAIASERPRWRLLATDASNPALQVARKNAEQCGIANIEFFQGDWCAALPPHVVPDIIVSNPPYIAADDPHLQQGDLRFEPITALKAADNGLKDIRHISSEAAELLKSGGVLLFEHGYQQAEAVRQILQSAGFVQVQSVRDLAGHERVTLGVKP